MPADARYREKRAKEKSCGSNKGPTQLSAGNMESLSFGAREKAAAGIAAERQFPCTRVNSQQFSRPSDFDPFYFAGVTSDADLDWAAADLAVYDGRKTPLRRIGERRKDRSAEGASHLDLLFEVHRKNLTRKGRTTRSFLDSGEVFSSLRLG